MTHAYHGDLKGIVLYDGCMECENRATRIWELDGSNLLRLGALGMSNNITGASYADRKALETLKLYARIVVASGITEEGR